MKLKSLRLANAMRAGSRQTDFLESKHYDMEFVDAVVIRILAKSKTSEEFSESYTSIFNAIWWQPLKETAAVKKGKP